MDRAGNAPAWFGKLAGYAGNGSAMAYRAGGALLPLKRIFTCMPP